MLKKKIIFTLFIIVIFRVLANIPVPGVDITAIRNYLSGNAVFGMLNLFSGGGFSNFSLVTLGLGPYINASIIMQIFTVVVPKLEELSKEGESGRKQIASYTRYLTVVLAAFHAFCMSFWLRGVMLVGYNFLFFLIGTVVALTAGITMVMWFSELITEHGIGNGA